ncbi:MAG: MscL family protein, partial [Mycobacterium sp.]
MFKGLKSFVMRGDVITVAVGLVVALAFSNLVKAFTETVINPLVAAAQPGHALGLGWQLGEANNKATFVDIGSFIGAIIYFIVFMATVYFAIVVPYRHIQKAR